MACQKLPPWFVLAFLIIAFFSQHLRAEVVLTKGNLSLSFRSTDASFAPRAPLSGICGIVLYANPLHGCSPLSVPDSTNPADSLCSRFVLVLRGICSFDTKVRNAQEAGFGAAIVCDDMESTELVTMAGSKRGISIPAVFVSKTAGKVLSKYANDSSVDCWIFPSYGNSEWVLMVLSICMLVLTTFVAACLVTRQDRNRYASGRRHSDPDVMSHSEVKAMPSIVYHCDIEAAETCVICLEDYIDGVTLRILPCKHRFHCSCIDAWLTTWKTFCPICKQDARSVPKASETTPLLNSNGPHLQSPTVVEGEEQVTAHEGRCIDAQESITRSYQRCYFSFHHLPPRPDSSPIRIVNARRHFSQQVLGLQKSARQNDPDFLDAFRASPYFTPPSSLLHNSAPNLTGSVFPLAPSPQTSTSNSGSPASNLPGNSALLSSNVECGDRDVEKA